MPLWAVVLPDLLLVGVILLSFAFAHHVYPALQSEWAQQETLANKPATEAQPAETCARCYGACEVTQPQTEQPTEPDNRTEWQKKFADHFTDEIVVTENSYTSPEVSVTIETVVTGEGSSKVTYYVADIYIASVENFTCATANNELRYFGTQPAAETAAQAKAILAISGDFITYQKSGFLLRNGEIYAADHNRNSICVL